MTDADTTDTDDEWTERDMPSPLTTEDLDYLCWYVVSHLDHAAWPDEQAAKALTAHDEITDENAEHEWGYFAGMFNMWEDMASVLNRYVDVWDRASQHASREGLPGFETLDHSDINDDAPRAFLDWPERDTIDIAERARELRDESGVDDD